MSGSPRAGVIVVVLATRKYARQFSRIQNARERILNSNQVAILIRVAVVAIFRDCVSFIKES